MIEQKTKKIQILNGYQQNDRFRVAVAEPDVYLYVPGAKDPNNLAGTETIPATGTIERLDILAEVDRDVFLFFWIEIQLRRYKLGRDIKIDTTTNLLNLLEKFSTDKKLFIGKGNKFGVSLKDLRQLEPEESIAIVGCVLEQKYEEFEENMEGTDLILELEQLPLNSLLIGQGADGLDFLTPGEDKSFITSESGTWVRNPFPKVSYLLLADRKANNTNGGTFSRNAWRVRDLNFEIDEDSLATIEGNQILLVKGKYRTKISCPAYDVGAHQARLFDVINNTEILLGTSEYSDTNRPSTTRSEIVGIFELAGNTTLEVQHRCSNTKTNQGFGRRCGFGSEEIYTVAEFWRLEEIE